MPYRRADVEYLRGKARQFRLLAGDCSGTPTAAKMLEIAVDLEAKGHRDRTASIPAPTNLVGDQASQPLRCDFLNNVSVQI